MQDKKRSIQIIKNVAYYSITLFLLFVIAVSLFIPNGLVKVFGVGWYRVVSESMEPLIMTGDYIVVTNDVDVENFKDGDIIIFQTHFYNRQVGTYVRDVVTHHFYGLDEAGYVLTYPHSQYQLDPENRRLDEWKVSDDEVYRLKQSDIIGRHVSTIKMSYVTAFLTSPYGVAVIVINSVLIVGLIIIFQYDKYKKQEKTKHDALDTKPDRLDESDSDDVEKMDE